jgi:aryl carrier-like protein
MRDATRQVIADVWRDVLKKDDIGVNENFFDIGGTSLLLAKVFAKLRAALNCDVTLVDLLRYPTIATLAANFDSRLQNAQGHPSIRVDT